MMFKLNSHIFKKQLIVKDYHDVRVLFEILSDMDSI
jgi:hypothetical protein